MLFQSPKIFESHSETDTLLFAESLIPLLTKGSLFLLEGEMGAGKSFLIRSLLRKLGVTGPIQSPTYTLINDYPIEHLGVVIHHADLYRLDEEDSLYDIEMGEFLKDDSILFVEWGKRFEMFQKVPHYLIEIEITGEISRRFSLTEQS